jgi:hypothetical protein
MAMTWPFVESPGLDHGSVLINLHCRLRTKDGHRVVTVRGITVATGAGRSRTSSKTILFGQMFDYIHR